MESNRRGFISGMLALGAAFAFPFKWAYDKATTRYVVGLLPNGVRFPDTPEGWAWAMGPTGKEYEPGPHNMPHVGMPRGWRRPNDHILGDVVEWETLFEGKFEGVVVSFDNGVAVARCEDGVERRVMS